MSLVPLPGNDCPQPVLVKNTPARHCFFDTWKSMVSASGLRLPGQAVRSIERISFYSFFPIEVGMSWLGSGWMLQRLSSRWVSTFPHPFLVAIDPHAAAVTAVV